MFTERESAEAEPPQCVSRSSNDSLAVKVDCASDIMLTAAPPQPRTHALVIGRHTLEPIIALMKSGCESVETHSLDTPNTHRGEASLAWISDIQTAGELDAAVHQASSCLASKGCMVLDATAMAEPRAVMVALKSLTKVGFRLRSVLRQGSHVILVAGRRPPFALAA